MPIVRAGGLLQRAGRWLSHERVCPAVRPHAIPQTENAYSTCHDRPFSTAAISGGEEKVKAR
ncbi:hypothetical protein RRF57_005902 [Xylaria bambusicola]|uniref:Uncharacterized protein n=1 Tax=Xylaria bambusicola TaxID=326684 RepID=A0AAN7Z6D6_9PEZI